MAGSRLLGAFKRLTAGRLHAQPQGKRASYAKSSQRGFISAAGRVGPAFSGDLTMSDLVFIAFDSEKKAEEVRDKILAMQREYLIEVSDAVIATRDENGRVKLNQLMHPAAAGAVSGAFWGMLIGWLFLMPVAGAAVGAASGALGGSLMDVGINDQQMKEQANEALKPGTAGLFLLIRKMTTDKVLEDLKGVGGAVIRTSFDHAKEDALKAALAGHVPIEQAPTS
jgi:uncharacterized membrane protein